MPDEGVSNRPLLVTASVWGAGARSLAKYAGPWSNPFLPGRVHCVSAGAKSAQVLSGTPSSHRYSFDTVHLRGVQSHSRAAISSTRSSPHFQTSLSDYSPDFNKLLPISCPTLDEFKDRMVSAVWENSAPPDWARDTVDLAELEEAPLSKEGHRVRGIQRSR
jgi:hypothetical protein